MVLQQAIATGFWYCPNPDCALGGEPHEIALTGGLLLVTHALQQMGLQNVKVPDPGRPDFILTDDRGSYVTVRPAQRAEDLVTQVALQNGHTPFDGFEFKGDDAT